MYYPKQIPYLLDKDFQDYIEYTEYNLKELEVYCMCLWSMETKKKIDKTIYNPILPDACIDLIIDFEKKELFFSGFSKQTELFPINSKTDYLGARLKPSVFYLLFHVKADQIMDRKMAFDKIEAEDYLTSILKTEVREKRIEILKTYLVNKFKTISSKKTIQLVELLYESPKEQSVIKLADSFSYNRRHLVRIFKTHYGISPKVLLNILRLHLCLNLLLEEKASLTDISLTCGFYDQAHFIKEIKKYTGFSPIQLFEKYGK